LAAAAQVTESILQLLTGALAPERTDIYDRMETFLRLPAGVSRAAGLSRMDALKRSGGLSPLFKVRS
jgi:hypothetical protein